MTTVFLRQSWAEINLAAIAHNFGVLKSLAASDSFFCPMVKANAYGHGAVEVTKRLEQVGAKHVGVSLVEEGVELREAGVKLDILIFGSFTDESSARSCLDHRLTPVLSNFLQIESLKKVAQNNNLKIHLKFDTGMSRLGFGLVETQKVKSEIESVPNWHVEGICTHLYRGDDSATSSGHSSRQIAELEKIVQILKYPNAKIHALNSAGLAAHALRKLSTSLGARPGIALYGAQPLPKQVGQIALQPVMTLKSKVLTTKWVEAGHSVSYNATWTASRKTLLGVVPIGYADGVHRQLTNNFEVLCLGSRVKVVGTVCMDYIMIDLTDLQAQLKGLGVGEEIVLFGQQGPAEITAMEWAEILGTIPYEIFTSISQRVPRVYVST